MKIGERIRKIIAASPYSVSEIAEQLGTTNQNLYRIFKKNSIETKYLENISKILDLDISLFFNESNNLNDIDKQESNLMLKLKKENESLKNQIVDLQDKLSDKIMILDFLKEKKAVMASALFKTIDSSLEYIDLNNIDELIKSLEQIPFDPSSQDEIFSYIEKKILEKKQKLGKKS